MLAHYSVRRFLKCACNFQPDVLWLHENLQTRRTRRTGDAHFTEQQRDDSSCRKFFWDNSHITLYFTFNFAFNLAFSLAPPLPWVVAHNITWGPVSRFGE